ncbi:sugar transferase [Ramlibacter sp.]|uniref:sugar transferase n=1 Tax=Ramlibacter sp. TaxID=1917967 RepID=UPI002607D8B5|nr:sugar transferase [Ramlibacter sp.]
MDVVLACLALALLAPLLLLVALAIALDGGLPVLFRQQRMGLGGRPFRIYKFRSMVKDAAAVGSYQTAQGDSRITLVGRFIRRTSLDELPQLLNVVKGDMSLVGPRPDLPQQQALYAPADWRLRCSVRPGITGLAQALLRSAATPQQRLELDLRYAREHSLSLDARILFWTLGRLSGRGAN